MVPEIGREVGLSCTAPITSSPEGGGSSEIEKSRLSLWAYCWPGAQARLNLRQPLPDGGRQSQRVFLACHLTNVQLGQLIVS
jgi:hypothetical protein